VTKPHPLGPPATSLSPSELLTESESVRYPNKNATDEENTVYFKSTPEVIASKFPTDNKLHQKLTDIFYLCNISNSLRSNQLLDDALLMSIFAAVDLFSWIRSITLTLGHPRM